MHKASVQGWCTILGLNPTEYTLPSFLKHGNDVHTKKYALPNNVKLNRGSYMRSHVLLNLLNEFGKSDKMRGLPSILLLFRNELNKIR